MMAKQKDEKKTEDKMIMYQATWQKCVFRRGVVQVNGHLYATLC